MRPEELLAWLPAAAAVVTGAALVAGGVALVATRSPVLALGIVLDLLLAAGLLRLAGHPGWTGIATAAAVVGLRRLIGTGLRWGSPGRPGPPRGRGARPAGPTSLERMIRPAWRA